MSALATIMEEEEGSFSSDNSEEYTTASTTTGSGGVHALRQFCSVSIAVKETKKRQLEQRRALTNERKQLRRTLTQQLSQLSESNPQASLYLPQTNQILRMKTSRSLKNVNMHLLEQCVHACGAAEPQLLRLPPAQAAKQLFAHLQSLRATFHHYADTEPCACDPTHLARASPETAAMVERFQHATAEYKALQATHKEELSTIQRQLLACTPQVSTFMQQKRTRSQRVHLTTSEGSEATYYVRTKQRHRKDQTKKFLLSMFERAMVGQWNI